MTGGRQLASTRRVKTALDIPRSAPLSKIESEPVTGTAYLICDRHGPDMKATLPVRDVPGLVPTSGDSFVMCPFVMDEQDHHVMRFVTEDEFVAFRDGD